MLFLQMHYGWTMHECTILINGITSMAIVTYTNYMRYRLPPRMSPGAQLRANRARYIPC